MPYYLYSSVLTGIISDTWNHVAVTVQHDFSVSSSPSIQERGQNLTSLSQAGVAAAVEAGFHYLRNNLTVTLYVILQGVVVHLWWVSNQTTRIITDSARGWSNPVMLPFDQFGSLFQVSSRTTRPHSGYQRVLREQ